MNPLFSNDDHDLRERFAALRRNDASDVPGFSATLRKPPARQPVRWLKPALAAALFVIVGLGAYRYYSRPKVETTASITEWKSPTDFLLETPGHQLLEGVPIGEWKPGEWGINQEKLHESTRPESSPAPVSKNEI